MDKSHVSIAQHVCPVCDAVFDSGEILLDRTLQDRFEMYTITGFELCKDHKKEGFYCLIAIDESKSEEPYTPQTAFKTGGHVHIKEEAAEKIFKDVEFQEFNYISEEAFNHLKSLYPPQEENE